jgi:hypothetical protein
MATKNLSAHNGPEADETEFNWLEVDDPRGSAAKWKIVTLKGDMNDPKQRELKEKMIKAYIRGWLEIYNEEENRNYKVTKVVIRNNYGDDERFTVKAFIYPPPEHGPHDEDYGNGHSNDGPMGRGHLVPPPPPPPDEI